MKITSREPLNRAESFTVRKKGNAREESFTVRKKERGKKERKERKESLEVFSRLIPGDAVTASGAPVAYGLGFARKNRANPGRRFSDSAILANRPKP